MKNVSILDVKEVVQKAEIKIKKYTIEDIKVILNDFLGRMNLYGKILGSGIYGIIPNEVFEKYKNAYEKLLDNNDGEIQNSLDEETKNQYFRDLVEFANGPGNYQSFPFD